jgi:hypothetical protein
VPIGANLSDFLFFHRPHALPWPLEVNGGAPIWTALAVKTGEITGISFPTGKVGRIRTLIQNFVKFHGFPTCG